MSQQPRQKGHEPEASPTPKGHEPTAYPAPPGDMPAAQPIPTTRPDTDPGAGSFRIPVLGTRRLAGMHVVLVGLGVQGHHTAIQLAIAGARLTIIDDGELNTPFSNGSWILAYHALDPMIALNTPAFEAEWADLRAGVLPAHLISWEHTVLENSEAAGPLPRELSQLRGFTLTAPEDPAFPHRATLLTQVAPTELVNDYIRKSLEESPNVTFIDRHIKDAEELRDLVREYDADLVVNSTGIEFAFMLDDRKMRLQYGALARFRMPEDWVFGVRSRDLGVSVEGFGHGKHLATSDPYYITQKALNRVSVGGVMWPMARKAARDLVESGFAVDERIVDEIVERAEKHFPELRGLERLPSVCSIRPGRTRLLFEYDRFEPRLLHCGGAGGSGATIAPYMAKSTVAEAIRLRDIVGC